MMTSKPAISTQLRRERRAYSVDFKAQIIHACHQPGASIAAIAQANDINTNVLHRWLREHDREGRHAAPAFLPVTVVDALGGTDTDVIDSAPVSPSFPDEAVAPPEEIQIECVRGNSKVTIRWPASAASDCGAWIRDWLA